jgi:hypothetical protein
VQTFLRFETQQLVPFSLYLGDVVLILAALSFLRIRGLRQRRADPDEEGRLSDWRRSVAHLAVAVMATILLMVMHRGDADFQTDLRLFGGYAVPGIVVVAFLVRGGVRRLPAFLTK